MSSKNTIINKASVLFLKYGIKVISMDNIADKCGVSKKTIYHYFLNKEDLINEIISFKIKEIELKIKNCSINSSNAIIELNCFFNCLKPFINAISPSYYNDLKKIYPNIYKKALKIIESDIIPFLQKNILRGQTEKYYIEDLNSEELSQSYNLIYQILISDNFFENIEKNNRAIDFLNTLYIHRLISVEGLKLLNTLDLHKNN